MGSSENDNSNNIKENLNLFITKLRDNLNSCKEVEDVYDVSRGLESNQTFAGSLCEACHIQFRKHIKSKFFDDTIPDSNKILAFIERSNRSDFQLITQIIIGEYIERIESEKRKEFFDQLWQLIKDEDKEINIYARLGLLFDFAHAEDIRTEQKKEIIVFLVEHLYDFQIMVEHWLDGQILDQLFKKVYELKNREKKDLRKFLYSLAFVLCYKDWEEQQISSVLNVSTTYDESLDNINIFLIEVFGNYQEVLNNIMEKNSDNSIIAYKQFVSQIFRHIDGVRFLVNTANDNFEWLNESINEISANAASPNLKNFFYALTHQLAYLQNSDKVANKLKNSAKYLNDFLQNLFNEDKNEEIYLKIVSKIKKEIHDSVDSINNRDSQTKNRTPLSIFINVPSRFIPSKTRYHDSRLFFSKYVLDQAEDIDDETFFKRNQILQTDIFRGKRFLSQNPETLKQSKKYESIEEYVKAVKDIDDDQVELVNQLIELGFEKAGDLFHSQINSGLARIPFQSDEGEMSDWPTWIEEKWSPFLIKTEHIHLLEEHKDSSSLVIPVQLGAYLLMAVYVTGEKNWLEKNEDEILTRVYSICTNSIIKIYTQFFGKYSGNTAVLYKKVLSYYLRIPENEIILDNDPINIYDYLEYEVRLSSFSEQKTKIRIGYPIYIESDYEENGLRKLTKTLVQSKIDELEDLSVNVTDRFRNTAIKTAIAAIMSRNMSHNIGSHVLSTVGTQSGEFNIKDVRTLFRFIQQRMDFIAQISTEFPKWSYPVWVVKDLMKHFYKQKYLLDYLAVSEGLGAFEYGNDGDGDGKESKVEIVLKYNGEEINKLENGGDALIAIPGGSVGMHAFYIILEDIIRNAAKHSFAKQEEIKDEGEKENNLKITIDIKDEPENEYVEFDIWDNTSPSENVSEDLPNDLDFCNDDDAEIPLHQKINCKLVKSLIDEQGRLRKENWGLAEMKISAGYLQKQRTEKLGGAGSNNLDIIRAVSKEGKLGYSYRIPKPKEVLLVSEDINDDEVTKIALKENSIYLSNTIPEDRDYEFMVLFDDVEDDFINAILDGSNVNVDIKEKIEKYPYRLFLVTDEEELVDNFTEERIVKISYESIANFLNKIDDTKTSEGKVKPEDGSPENGKVTSDQLIEKIKDQKKENTFKLWLYRKWVEQFNKDEDKIKVLVKVKGGPGENADGEDTSWLFEEVKKIEGDSENYEEIKKDIEKKLGLRDDYEPNTIPDLLKEISITELEKEPWTSGDLDDTLLENDFIEILDPNENSYEQDDFKNSIMYWHHKDLRYLGELGNNKYTKYFETLTGATTHFSLIANPPISSESNYLKSKILMQLIENGLLKVGICDERVSNSSFIDNTNFEKLKFSQVYVIDHLKLANGKFWEYKHKNRSKSYKLEVLSDGVSTKNENDQLEGLDVVIIHLGIFDKIGLSRIEIQNEINNIKNYIPNVIITSGRGAPSNMPNNAKYLPFSTIESFLLCQNHRKFLLTQSIMSIVS